MEKIEDVIKQAFMAGQADCGVDPSYSSAQAYAIKNKPEGYTLVNSDTHVAVPREPTEAMIEAGWKALPECVCTENQLFYAALCYKAMLKESEPIISGYTEPEPDIKDICNKLDEAIK